MKKVMTLLGIACVTLMLIVGLNGSGKTSTTVRTDVELCEEFIDAHGWDREIYEYEIEQSSRTDDYFFIKINMKGRNYPCNIGTIYR